MPGRLWKRHVAGLLGMDVECEDFCPTLDNQMDEMTHRAYQLVSSSAKGCSVGSRTSGPGVGTHILDLNVFPQLPCSVSNYSWTYRMPYSPSRYCTERRALPRNSL